MLQVVRSTRRGGARIATRARDALTTPICTRSVSTSAPPSDHVEKLFDEGVMEHLVCPISKYPLRYDAARGLIICPEIRVAYPIHHGVPLLVPSEGRILRDDEDA